MSIIIKSGSSSSLANVTPAGAVQVDGSAVTQPVSIALPVAVTAASLPLPTGAAADGTDATGVTPPIGAVGIRGWLSSIWNKLNTSIVVTGTFWQTTQPVSGTVAVSNLPTTQPVSAVSLPLPAGAATSALQPTLVGGRVPVDGSGVTQPVSVIALPLPSGAAADGTDGTGIAAPTGAVGIRGWLSGIYKALTGTLTAAISGTATVAQATAALLNAVVHLQDGAGNSITSTTGHLDVNIASTAVIQPVSATALPLPAGASTSANQTTELASLASVVTNTTTTAKGTQGAAGLPTQDLKDSGRSKVILTLTKATSITTEALVTLTQKKGDAVTSTGTSYTVTAGKTLRLQAMLLSATLTVAGITAVAVRLREGASGGGAVSATSDIITEIEVSANIATIGVSTQQELVFPDGLELVGGQQIGVSELATTVDAAVTVCIVGYEY